MYDKVVCERECVKAAGPGGGREGAGRGPGGGREERDTESKTRTPHKDVGNKKLLKGSQDK